MHDDDPLHDAPLSIPSPMRGRRGMVAAGLITLMTFGAGPVLGVAAGAMGATMVEVLPTPSPASAQVVWQQLSLDDGADALPAEAASAEGEGSHDGAAPSDLAGEASAAAAASPSPGGPKVAGTTTTATSGRASGAKLTAGPRTSTASAAAAAPKKAKRSKRCDAAPDQPMIDEVGPQHYAVDRDLVKSYTRSLKRLNELGWSKPHEGPDGRKDGMFIGGVKCGSDLHIAGLRSGDVVHTVNGRKVKSFAQALLVYQAVRNDDRVVVEVTRRGKRRTLTYDLS